ncbi:MAG: tRNA pseudouridine(55) synthase TruB [Defluviitaleaceae bacterium]|nr:tRNA pseudouridine(55) synthase TruB [Defluviitaleaceae bacterium]MCL2240569.1 tRNA pseudouridine(55) synthase TruB [Defluviitaleaceae bacterium]
MTPGIINVYKEKGYTSHDVVAILRKLAGAKAGHTGTLDPNAEGVLPICLGQATKLAGFFSGADKTYVAEVVPGVTTDTGDMTGTVLTQQNVCVGADAFEKAVAGFVGEQLQTPPMYSAIKIGGKKLYELARKGETVERTPRRVLIEEIRVLSRGEGSFFIEVSCSKGTYIRSLCADIGEALGCGAAMGALTRTRSGLFFLEKATKIAELKEAAQGGGLREYLIPVDAALPYPRAGVREAGLTMALNGNPLPMEMVAFPEGTEAGQDKYWLCAPDERLIGLFATTPAGDRLRAEVML